MLQQTYRFGFLNLSYCEQIFVEIYSVKKTYRSLQRIRVIGNVVFSLMVVDVGHIDVIQSILALFELERVIISLNHDRFFDGGVNVDSCTLHRRDVLG